MWLVIGIFSKRKWAYSSHSSIQHMVNVAYPSNTRRSKKTNKYCYTNYTIHVGKLCIRHIIRISIDPWTSPTKKAITTLVEQGKSIAEYVLSRQRKKKEKPKHIEPCDNDDYYCCLSLRPKYTHIPCVCIVCIQLIFALDGRSCNQLHFSPFYFVTHMHYILLQCFIFFSVVYVIQWLACGAFANFVGLAITSTILDQTHM